MRLRTLDDHHRQADRRRSRRPRRAPPREPRPDPGHDRLASETPSAATIAQDKAAVTQARPRVKADQKALAETTLRAPSPAWSPRSTTRSAPPSAGPARVSRGASMLDHPRLSVAAARAAGSSSTARRRAPRVRHDQLARPPRDRRRVRRGGRDEDRTRPAGDDHLPGATNTEVAGKVVAVSSTSTVVSNVVTYNETIALVNPPAEVKEGMTANVSVVDQTRGHVLELPSSAITTNGDDLDRAAAPERQDDRDADPDRPGRRLLDPDHRAGSSWATSSSSRRSASRRRDLVDGCRGGLGGGGLAGSAAAAVSAAGVDRP